MTEKLLQFIWAFGYFNKSELTASGGEPLVILSAGTLNKNQGPDFLNARIRIGKALFAGSVELHLKTSDWNKHRHQEDGNYKNVVLHVVYRHDEAVNDIPVLPLFSRISSLLLQRYAAMMETSGGIPCGSGIGQLKELTWKSWKERLLAERLSRKADYVLNLFAQSNNHWEEAFWWLLARNFGSKINGDAFEAVARSIPVNLLAKHKASLHQIEALLMGQAGLLNEDFDEEYPKLLQREYCFLKNKYSLQTVPVPMLFLRMRPGNFPTLRLAQLAVLVQQSSHLFSTVLETASTANLMTVFAVTANDFWHYHYTFRQASGYKKKTLGAVTINTLLINAVAPAVFAYGLYHRSEAYKTKAVHWLEALPAESNTIITEFLSMGVEATSAYDTQALLEQRNSYCNEKRCLDCSVGNFLLREAAEPYAAAGSDQNNMGSNR